MTSQAPSQVAATTRRAALLIQGMLWILLGGMALFIGQAVEFLQPPRSYWLLLLVPPVLAAAYFHYRRLRQSGLWIEGRWEPFSSILLRFNTPEDFPQQPLLQRTAARVLILTTLLLVVYSLGQKALTGTLPQTPFHVAVGLGAVALATQTWDLVREHGLREHLLTTAWFALGGLYTAVFHQHSSLVFGGGVFLMGLLLHWRWRAFIRTADLETAA